MRHISATLTTRRALALVAALAAVLFAAAPAAAERANLADYDSLVDLTDSLAGTASGSGPWLQGDAASYGPRNAFDNKFGGDTSRVIFDATTGWVAWTFSGEPQVVDAFTMRVPTWLVADRAPRTFSLSGSNDGGATWTVLDTEADETGWTAQEKRLYVFDNEGAYQSYKFEVTAIGTASEARVQYSELELVSRNSFALERFVWQPTLARGAWSDAASWVDADKVTGQRTFPNSKFPVSFAEVAVPEVVVEIDGVRGASQLDFSGSVLTNVVFRKTAADARFVIGMDNLAAGDKPLVLPATPGWTWTIDGLQVQLSGADRNMRNVAGTFRLVKGADLLMTSMQFGAVGTRMNVEVNAGSSFEANVFAISAGSTLTLRDGVATLHYMNLTWDSWPEPGSIRFEGSKGGQLVTKQLYTSNAACTGTLEFLVPAEGYDGAPIVCDGTGAPPTRAFSFGPGRILFSIDPASPVFTARHAEPVEQLFVLWPLGIEPDYVDLAPLPKGSAWHYGYGADGTLDTPASDGDLPTALWASLAHIPQGTVLFLR